MRTRSFRLQIANIAADALPGCSVTSASGAAGLPHGMNVQLMLSCPRTLQDPEIRAEADRLALEIDPVTGEILQAMVDCMFGAPREVVQAARRAIGQRRCHAAIYSRRGRRRGGQHRI
jgi:hypothetical protein